MSTLLQPLSTYFLEPDKQHRSEKGRHRIGKTRARGEKATLEGELGRSAQAVDKSEERREQG